MQKNPAPTEGSDRPHRFCIMLRRYRKSQPRRDPFRHVISTYVLPIFTAAPVDVELIVHFFYVVGLLYPVDYVKTMLHIFHMDINEVLM